MKRIILRFCYFLENLVDRLVGEEEGSAFYPSHPFEPKGIDARRGKKRIVRLPTIKLGDK